MKICKKLKLNHATSTTQETSVAIKQVFYGSSLAQLPGSYSSFYQREGALRGFA